MSCPKKGKKKWTASEAVTNLPSSSIPSVPQLQIFCNATVAFCSLTEYKVPKYQMLFLGINESILPVGPQ